MTKINTVSIKIQTGVYGQFRNLNNKVWFALGEYVDNAVQSFENNYTNLKKIDNDYQFEIKIEINWEKDFIRIYDNAAGIDENNFVRAFEPANIPISNSGLHEFGMGMKTASIWLADSWSVRTAALFEREERKVDFNLKTVLDEDKEILEVQSILKDSDVHFTEIILRELSKNAPSSFQMDKIKKHLASIYRKFLRSGNLKLYVNNEMLKYNEPEILLAPIYNDLNSKPVLWRKDISFSTGKYTVNGFIALLSTMSTSEVNGLSLFRRGRVIEGSHDEKYRPKVLCGHVGSPRYKRLFGELELTGFSVSFNKGSFQEQDDLEALMESLQATISNKDFDLYNQGERYLKPKTPETNVKVAKNLVSALKKNIKESNNNEFQNVPDANRLNSIDANNNNDKLNESAKILDSFEELINISGEHHHLKVSFITEPNLTDLYTLHISNDKNEKAITYKINLAHLFFAKFERIKNEEDYQPFIVIIRSLVLAEIYATEQGTKNAGNIRINFNHFLRNL